ncbi:hypothetical protein [Mucilaginibacter sp. OK098]|uniref:hypothetical protein n=1 Tax=Mucilaginibacter sp. OK098 TaxID=1855297 RepID=UPI00091F8B32|nr:hypothetical protein [Mucilaginibacter sp. OK098]SHM41858.1 hypothetical protein SAMN05216524_10250 [Mucilaginibacter sp. OK098]
MKKSTYSSFLILAILLLTSLFPSCHKSKKVNTSFYYWKTVYKTNPTETAYLKQFQSHKLYVRIMDVNMDEDGISPVPISPITFKDKLPDSVQIVPIVFIVNDVLKTITKARLDDLAAKLITFVTAKVQQAGNTSFNELQIDCDWTTSTRDNYFYLLNRLKLNPALKHKTLSATLRLHQLKNQKGSGIPPVSRVMLMCYNMGNLRKYGSQNSILEISELKKYLGDNISKYPMPVDVGLPLFSWAVAFRNREYIGISKRIKIVDLNNKNQFIFIGNNIYKAAADLPEYGLLKADEVRWEAIPVPVLEAVASYISPLIKTDTINVIYFHLDETVIKPYTFPNLQKVNNLLR